MPTDPYRRSTLALAVLSLLAESPMHPYRMQQLIRERGKDKVVNVGQRASLYKTIERMQKLGLVAIRLTTRDTNRPERTIYELTELGREVLEDWMRDALGKSRPEFPEFPAALSFMPLLSPEAVREQLELRQDRLRVELSEIEKELATLPIPRLFLVEDEYRAAMLRAEIDWVGRLIEDLRSGSIAWTDAWRRSKIDPLA